MTARNAYATLAEYKNYVTARGQTSSTDATDDTVIDGLLETASRYIEDETGRQFYPLIQARLFDVPSSRELYVDDDLLEIITLTNGDSTTMPSTEYYLVPRNYFPAYALKITDISTYTWLTNSAGSFENAISVLGIWAFRSRYTSEGWKVGTTTAEILDTTETEFDVAASTLFSPGQIIRYGNELGIISSVTSGKINVVSRGDNGSTAAAHDSGITVYIWQPEQGAKNAVLEIANSAYNRRFGNSTSNAVTITAAGVVISPRDIPATAQAFIETHKDRT
jgi:hypothetical protein